jgi:uncharacterized protein YkwD
MRICLAAIILFGLATSAQALDVNGYRAKNGRGPLTVDSHLAGIAQFHARDLAVRNALDHRGFATERGPLGANAEVVGYGCGDESCAILQWSRSGPHRAAMLRKDISTYGIANVVSFNGRHYWVMELGGAAPIVRTQRGGKQYMESAASKKR